MTHNKYNIKTWRRGISGEWGAWKYWAKSIEPMPPRVTGIHESWNSIAEELASFPGILEAELIPYASRRVRLGEESNIQYGDISDKDLAELADRIKHHVLVQRYYSKLEK